MTSDDKPVHFSPYTNVYDADNMRRVPPDIHTPEELMEWLHSLHRFRSSHQ